MADKISVEISILTKIYNFEKKIEIEPAFKSFDFNFSFKLWNRPISVLIKKKNSNFGKGLKILKPIETRIVHSKPN